MAPKKPLFDSSLKAGIYKITCLSANDGVGRHYVGCSIHVVKRLNAHKNKLRRNIHECKLLQDDFNKYGERNFIFEKLLIGAGEDKELLLQLETAILLTLPETLRYNMYSNWRVRDSSTNPFFGKLHTAEAKEVQSRANKNKTSSFKGHTQTNEVKEFLSQQNKGQSSVERRKPLYIDSVYYESVSEANARTGLARRLIRERCHSTEERWKNYQWVEKDSK
jgi:hypothetical protein